MRFTSPGIPSLSFVQDKFPPRQGSTGHDIGPRISKSSSSPEKLDSRILRGYCGAKGIGDPGPFHIKPMAHAEEKGMSEDEKKSSDRQDTLPRTTLSSANRDHEKGKYHAIEGSLLERPNGESQCCEPPIGAWWRSNPMKSCHIRIKYTQLISWPHLCGRDP